MMTIREFLESKGWSYSGFSGAFRLYFGYGQSALEHEALWVETQKLLETTPKILLHMGRVLCTNCKCWRPYEWEKCGCGSKNVALKIPENTPHPIEQYTIAGFPIKVSETPLVPPDTKIEFGQIKKVDADG